MDFGLTIKFLDTTDGKVAAKFVVIIITRIIVIIVYAGKRKRKPQLVIGAHWA